MIKNIAWYIYFTTLVLCLNNCQNKNESEPSIVIEHLPSLKIPVSGSVVLPTIRILSNQTKVIYQSKYDLVSYDINTEELTRDTTLRQYDYIFNKTSLLAMLDSLIILKDFDHLYIYSPSRKSIETIDLIPGKQNSISDSQRLLLGSRFGRTNLRFYSFIPLVPLPDYLTDSKKINIKFYDPISREMKSYIFNKNQELLSNIFNSNSNLLTPEIDTDIDGNGINLVFMLSCRVFNIKFNGTVSEYKIESPDCICEIDKENFIKATADNFWPKSLPMYGNILPDLYRNVYYQIYKTPWNLDLENRKMYLRIIDKNYSLTSEVSIDIENFFPQIIVLEDGAYIQSIDNPDEDYLYFRKINLVQN